MGRRQSDDSLEDSGKRKTLASAFTPQRAANSTPTARRQQRDARPTQYDQYEHYDQYGEYDDIPDEDAGFAVPPFLNLPTRSNIPAMPAQSSPGAPGASGSRQQRPANNRSGIEGIEGLDVSGDAGEWDDDYYPGRSNPGASDPYMSSPRLRAASNAGPLHSRPDQSQPGIAGRQTGKQGRPQRNELSDPRGQSGKHPAQSSGKHPAQSGKHERPQLAVAVMEQSQPRALAPRKPNRSRALVMLDTVFIPGRNLTQRLIPKPIRRRLARPTFRLFDFIQRRRVALIALLILVLATGLLVNATGLARVEGQLSSAWRAFSGATPLPTPLVAPDITDPGHYVAKYGFDWPGPPSTIPGDEWTRLAFMVPYAIQGTNAADAQNHATIEPEMVVWWTYAEGIGGRINYSNCANEGTRPGTNFFTDIENCDHSSFWQLGYGNQFSVIYVLKDAFTALYGDPNNTQLVQKVGQKVLDFDASQGTIPSCGGYSCTFPAMTISQIMSGINENTGVMTADNWWASVLSRDPLINCYMIAYALEFFNHAATRNWIGCYYYEPCWGYESNRLGDILSAWPALRQAAGLPATPTGSSL